MEGKGRKAKVCRLPRLKTIEKKAAVQCRGPYYGQWRYHKERKGKQQRGPSRIVGCISGQWPIRSIVRHH